MATPNTNGKDNSIYLKVIIGLLSLSGTLFSIIGMGILNSLDDLKKQMQVNTTTIAVHETKFTQVLADITSLQSAVHGLEGIKEQWAVLYALKPDEVGRRKRYIGSEN